MTGVQTCALPIFRQLTQKHQFTQGMRFVELDMTNVLFDTYKNNLEYQFTEGMWFEETGMIEVLFDIQTNSRKHGAHCNKPKYGKESFY